MAAGTSNYRSMALFSAVRAGDAHAVAAWLDEGGGVDAGCAEFSGATLLMTAAAVGQEAIVRMLLQRGASVNLQTSDWSLGQARAGWMRENGDVRYTHQYKHS